MTACARAQPAADLLLDHRLRADGPYAHRAGYDYIIQGMSGLMSVTGEPDGQPQKVGVAVTDIFTGVYAATAILAAVHQRAQHRARASTSTWRCWMWRPRSWPIRR